MIRKVIMLKYSTFIVWCLFFVFLNPCLPITAHADKPIILCLYPYQHPRVLEKSFTPLANYLQKKLGQPVEINIAKNYQEHIDNVGGGHVEIAFVGPASYVKLTNVYGPQNLLGRLEVSGKETYQGVIIVRKESKLQTIADLHNKRFVFGDVNSTMSHIIPRYTLWEAGVDVKDLAYFKHVNNHSNVAMAVLAGDFDAGAVTEATFHRYKNRGLRAMAMTQEIPEHVFITSNKVSPVLVGRLKKALHQLNDDPEGKTILTSIKPTITGIVPVKNADYDSLREILKQLKTLGVDFDQISKQ